MNSLFVHVFLVIFVATFVRSTFGFGETLVGLPLLALRMPVETAAPLAVLVSITVAAIVVVQDRRDIHLGSAARLVAWSLPGIPFGLWLLLMGEERVVKGVLAVVIVAFAGWSLLGRRPPALKEESRGWLAGCGLLAGVLGGAYGLNGPPLILYGAMRRWSAAHFRATLQAYFLPASILGMGGYAFAGLWTTEVTRLFALTLPATLAAILLGRAANRRLEGQSFLRYVYVALMATGALLLAQAVRG